MNEINCIFCEIESNLVVIEENGYKGKKCPQCGLIYISPRPSFNEIVNLYGHDNAQISAEAHLSSDYLKRLYARHHLRIIHSFVDSGDLLEIGSGGGYFLDEARKMGFIPHGLELNSIQAEYIKETLKIQCEESSIDTKVFGGKKFDIIFHCDVISHFFDPISEFYKMNQIMEDAGYLIFETGNFGEVNQKYFRHIKRFQYPDHLFFFSTGNLITLLEETGFELERIYRYSILPQLRVSNVLSGIKNKITQRQAEKPSGEIGATIDQTPSESKKKNIRAQVSGIIKKRYHYFVYILRYIIGGMVLKINRPQTMIIVARKKKRKIE